MRSTFPTDGGGPAWYAISFPGGVGDPGGLDDQGRVSERVLTPLALGAQHRELFVLQRVDRRGNVPHPAEDWPDGRQFSEERSPELGAIAAMSCRGELVVSTRSGHHVQIDEPELVVAAIRRVVQEEG